MAPHANGVKDSGRGRGAKRGSPRASLGPSRCDFDPLMVLPSRRDNGNKAQGRGASPRTLGMRVVYETSVEPKTTSTTRVFRDRNTRRVTSGACRVGVKRTAGCFGLGDRRCVATCGTRPTTCRRPCTQGYAAKRGSPRASLGPSRCDFDRVRFLRPEGTTVTEPRVAALRRAPWECGWCMRHRSSRRRRVQPACSETEIRGVSRRGRVAWG